MSRPCQHIRCDEEATQRVAIPTGSGLPLVLVYCEAHAEVALKTTPGARVVGPIQA